jgi:hypothetical protein
MRSIKGISGLMILKIIPSGIVRIAVHNAAFAVAWRQNSPQKNIRNVPG